MIPFSGLKLGFHDFEYAVGDAFFEAFDASEITKGDFEVQVQLNKHETMLEFEFAMKGTVETQCDRCTEALSIELAGDQRLIVKFGAESYDQTDEIIVIPDTDYEINIAQYIYEFLHLLLPSKRVHAEGECNEEIIAKLHSLSRSDDEEDDIDPRWAALKGIK